ncbi:MAG: methionyl-tRNA formyltransferase [Candidatus Altimarinota bacterium]
MRIVVLLPKLHAGAELALNHLLRRKDLDIVGVVRSDISPFRKKYWKYVKYGVRRAGVFYGALIALTAYIPAIGLSLASVLIWKRRGKWLSVDELVRRHDLRIHDTENINDPASIEVLRSWEPDVFVTVYFDQILKKPVLEIPRTASLNMHPGLLPKYRGIWPEFWKLHNKEKYAGVTVHYINEEIDAGEVVGQIRYPIEQGETKFSLLMKSAQKGTNLLIRTLSKMKKGTPLKTLRLKGEAQYYSLPTKLHFDQFYARGGKLFSIMAVWREILKLF